MKNVIIMGFALFTGGALIAQEETETKQGADTTTFNIGATKIIIVGNDTTIVNSEDEDDKGSHGMGDDLTYWTGFELGVNVPVNGKFQSSFDSKHLEIDPAQSFTYSFNIFEKRIRIINDYFGLVTGLGFTNSRYGFKDNRVRLESNADSTFGVLDTTLFNGFSKNQLRVNTFNIPLMFQVNTSKNEDKNFHLSFGAIGGVRIGSNVKYKYDLVDGGQAKDKVRAKYNLNPFQLLATVRLGFNDFGLFANYDVLTLYETGKSETAYPLSFGLSFHL
jgi:hypothetical protein